MHKLRLMGSFFGRLNQRIRSGPTWTCSPECCGLHSSALSQNTPPSDGPGRPGARTLPCVRTQKERGNGVSDESAYKGSRRRLEHARIIQNPDREPNCSRFSQKHIQPFVLRNRWAPFGQIQPPIIPYSICCEQTGRKIKQSV